MWGLPSRKPTRKPDMAPWKGYNPYKGHRFCWCPCWLAGVSRIDTGPEETANMLVQDSLCKYPCTVSQLTFFVAARLSVPSVVGSLLLLLSVLLAWTGTLSLRAGGDARC